MIGVAALWIAALLLIGGFALDRVLTRSIVDSFDNQLVFVLNSMIASSEIGPDGEVRFNRPPADQRFVEPYSGLYFQISGVGRRHLPVALAVGSAAARRRQPRRREAAPLRQRRILDPGPCRAAAHRRARRDPARLEDPLALPGRAVARDDRRPDPPPALDPVLELPRARRRACSSSPRCRPSTASGRCGGCATRSPSIRSGDKTRIGDEFPAEIRPLTEEINQLLAHSEAQAEEARRHAGNLAHALKTPLTVITNAATARFARPCRHRLPRSPGHAPPGRPPPRPRPGDRPPRRRPSRARACGKASKPCSARSTGCYEDVTVDIAGDHQAQVRVERQDLDEMLGNLVENAAKYGGGRVFVTVEPKGATVDILVEDDGPGIPEERRGELFTRGARLDTTGQARHRPRPRDRPRRRRDLRRQRSASRRARTSAACWRG